MGRPALVNIDHYQGDTLEVFFRVRERVWRDDLEVWQLGDYINLAGGVAKGHVKAQKSDADPLVAFACTLSNQAETPGGVLAVLSAAQTTLLTGRTYYYDIQVELAGVVETYVAGVINVEQEVTKNA